MTLTKEIKIQQNSLEHHRKYNILENTTLFIIKKRSDVIEKSFLKCLEIRFKEENIKKYKELKI